jgi:hypothetical protein
MFMMVILFCAAASPTWWGITFPRSITSHGTVRPKAAALKISELFLKMAWSISRLFTFMVSVTMGPGMTRDKLGATQAVLSMSITLYLCIGLFFGWPSISYLSVLLIFSAFIGIELAEGKEEDSNAQGRNPFLTIVYTLGATLAIDMCFRWPHDASMYISYYG